MRLVGLGCLDRKNGTAIWCLSGCDFPEDDTETKDVGFFCVLIAADDFWSHPLVSPDLAGHVILEAFGPPEICEFDFPTVVEQQVEAFEIAVQHGHRSLMEIIHGKRSAEGQLSAIFPAEFLLPLQQRPQRPSLAVLQHNSEMGRLGAGSQKHHDIRMPQGLHSVAFTHEISDCILVVLLDLEDLDRHCAASPGGLVNYAVSALGNLLA